MRPYCTNFHIIAFINLYINLLFACVCVSATANVECCDLVSDSSGVCTSNSGSAESYDATPTDATLFHNGMLVVCLQQYTPHKPGHLDINAGDILEGKLSPKYIEWLTLPFFLFLYCINLLFRRKHSSDYL